MSTIRILAIDTATEACSVALLCDGKILSRFTVSPREHAQKILPLVESVLAEAGISLYQLDALAFGRGPGSFTGVRIGVSVAQGLAFGADLPLIGVSSLMTLAQGALRTAGKEKIFAAIDARMNEVYCAQYVYKNGVWQGEETEAVLKPDTFVSTWNETEEEWGIVGTGWEAYPQLSETSSKLISTGVVLPAAEDMLPIACHLWAKKRVTAAEDAQPHYLRNEITWKKLPGRE